MFVSPGMSVFQKQCDKKQDQASGCVKWPITSLGMRLQTEQMPSWADHIFPLPLLAPNVDWPGTDSEGICARGEDKPIKGSKMPPSGMFVPGGK